MNREFHVRAGAPLNLLQQILLHCPLSATCLIKLIWSLGGNIYRKLVVILLSLPTHLPTEDMVPFNGYYIITVKNAATIHLQLPKHPHSQRLSKIKEEMVYCCIPARMRNPEVFGTKETERLGAQQAYFRAGCSPPDALVLVVGVFVGGGGWWDGKNEMIDHLILTQIAGTTAEPQ